jgi:hypothetical protein
MPGGAPRSPTDGRGERERRARQTGEGVWRRRDTAARGDEGCCEEGGAEKVAGRDGGTRCRTIGAVRGNGAVIPGGGEVRAIGHQWQNNRQGGSSFGSGRRADGQGQQ